MRLAIVTTHPIQYYAPVFKLLAQQFDVMVFYTWGEGSMTKHDPGFNKTITWDINLLESYPYQWLKNNAARPGSHHFNGIDNPDIIDRIEAWQPEVILVYGWAYKSHLKVLRHFKHKLPIFFRGDSTALNTEKWPKALVKMLYLKWIYSHVDNAFYVGTNNKAYFKKYGLTDGQLIFAPHAVDNDRFSTPRADEAGLLRQQFNIADDAKLVLYAGKFEPVKNLQLLLSAFIKANVPNTHLLLVGNGTTETELKTIATNSVIADRIHFMDFSNQGFMPVVYQAADIFCLPSVSETWGLAVNEAMACAKPVLVSNKVGCAIDLVTQGTNGYIYAANNNADILEKLSSLLHKGKAELALMGQASLQTISRWSFAVQVNQIVNALNERK